METAIIIVLLFMLLIAVIILLDINFDRKAYKIIIQDCSAALDKSKKENDKLKSKNENLKISIDEQEARFNKHLKKTFDYGESKTNELLTKYKSSLIKINERDEKIRNQDIEIMALRADSNHFNKAYVGLDNEVNHLQNLIDEKEAIIKLRDSQIIELEKTKKKYSQRVYELHGEKDFAIHQSKSSIKLCNEMSKMFKLMNSELESIETQLLEKLNP
jgi:hypothetical protein